MAACVHKHLFNSRFDRQSLVQAGKYLGCEDVCEKIRTILQSQAMQAVHGRTHGASESIGMLQVRVCVSANPQPTPHVRIHRTLSENDSVCVLPLDRPTMTN